MFNHEAIRRIYPNAVTINDSTGAFDVNGNKIELDQNLIDAATVEVVTEQTLATAKFKRSEAYRSEADPLFFKAQRGEATTDEWTAKVAEIKARFPYPGGEA